MAGKLKTLKDPQIISPFIAFRNFCRRTRNFGMMKNSVSTLMHNVPEAVKDSITEIPIKIFAWLVFHQFHKNCTRHYEAEMEWAKKLLNEAKCIFTLPIISILFFNSDDVMLTRVLGAFFKAGCDPNAKIVINSNCKTIMLFEITRRFKYYISPIVELLNADILVEITPLGLACAFGNQLLIRMLLRQGADVSLVIYYILLFLVGLIDKINYLKSIIYQIFAHLGYDQLRFEILKN